MDIIRLLVGIAILIVLFVGLSSPGGFLAAIIISVVIAALYTIAKVVPEVYVSRNKGIKGARLQVKEERRKRKDGGK